MKDWNSIYQSQGVVQTVPSARVLAAIASFGDSGLSRILDLGCGTGRHTTALADKGFDVYGCDCSEEALKVISSLIAEANFCQCDMT